MPMWTVQETDRYRRALEEISRAGHDVTESIEAARWYLERAPLYVGKGTQDHEVRIPIMDAPAGRPSIKLFYLVEGQSVSLLSVRIAEPPQL